MSDSREIESMLFKPVPGGYVYQAANPWVFGPTTRYVVNDTQKAELLAVITPRRPWLQIVMIVAVLLVIVLATATFMWAISPDGEPDNVHMLVLVGLILVQIYLALLFAVRRKLRRTQPITAGLPRTDERITRSELRKQIADAMTLKRSLVVAAAWSVTTISLCVALAFRSGQHPLFSDVQSYVSLVGAIFAAGLTVNYTAISIRKMRQRGEVA